MNYTPLYEGRTIRLTPIDIEKDATVIADWSKVLENLKSASDNGGHTFFFALRPSQEERLVGFLRLVNIQWVHGAGLFSLVIGDEQDWKASANEALGLALNYAFDELNLFRVTVRIPEDDYLAVNLFRRAQFFLEVRQRQAIFRDGRYVDRLSFGLLRPEWDAYRLSEVA